MGWGTYAPLVSSAVCVNPGSAFNCYWVMPFRKKCRITMENIGDADPMTLYYQIDYTLTEVPDDAAYFHAQYRRLNPNVTSDYTIVDGIKGKGHYVGVYLAWGVNNNGWWGEGEIKFFIDGDTKFPTICGTGTEDYICGSYDFDTRKKNAAGVEEVNYTEFCTPYSGLHQVIRGDGHYNVMQRFGMYRWHIMDPVRFDKDLKITIQDLGWRQGGRYLAQKSDIASVCYWYQADPHSKYPEITIMEGAGSILDKAKVERRKIGQIEIMKGEERIKTKNIKTKKNMERIKTKNKLSRAELTVGVLFQKPRWQL